MTQPDSSTNTPTCTFEMDGDLLTRFIEQRDESALVQLIEKHKSLVMGVCMQILGNLHDAEDAFQSVFLKLAKKADRIKQREAISSWLYQVAHHESLNMNRQQKTKSASLISEEPLKDEDLLTESERQEQLVILHNELNDLPEKFRDPLVLCCLEGRSRQEAADELKLTEITVKGRLTRGRELLKQRLLKRGIALTVVLGLWETSQASAAVLVTASITHQTAALCMTHTLATQTTPTLLSLKGLTQMGILTAKVSTVAVTLGLAAFGGWAMLFEPETSRELAANEESIRPAKVQFSLQPPVILENLKQTASMEADRMLFEVGDDRFSVPNQGLSLLSFSPDGKYITSIFKSDEGTNTWLGFWNRKTGEREKAIIIARNRQTVSAYRFIEKGAKLLTTSVGTFSNKHNSQPQWRSGGGFLTITEVSTGKELVNNKRHEAHIERTAFSPDGQLLATVDYLGTIKVSKLSAPQETLWTSNINKKKGAEEDSENPTRLVGRREREAYLEGTYPDRPANLGFTNDSQELFFRVLFQKDLHFLNSKTGAPSRTVNLHQQSPQTGGTHYIDEVQMVETLHNNQKLLTVDRSRIEDKNPQTGDYQYTNQYQINIREVSTGNILNTYLSERKEIQNAAFFLSHDKMHLAMIHDGQIEIIELKTGKTIQTLQQPSRGYSELVFGPDDKTLASRLKNTILSFDLKTGELLLPPSKKHLGPVRSVEILNGISTNPKQDNVTSEPLVTIDSVLQTGSDVFVTDGSFGWELKTGKPLLSPEGFHNNMVLSKDRSVMAYHKKAEKGSSQPQKSEIVVSHLKQNFTMSIPITSQAPVLALSDNGTRLAVTNGNLHSPGTVRFDLWQIPHLKSQMDKLRILSSFPTKQDRKLKGHEIKRMQFTPDQEHLLLATDSGDIMQWGCVPHVSTTSFNAFPFTTRPLENRIYTFRIDDALFTHNGKYALIVGEEDKILYQWDLDRHRILRSIELPSVSESPLLFTASPDSRYLAVCRDKWLDSQESTTISILDLETGNQLLKLQTESGCVTAINFSPEGNRLLLGFQSGIAQVWDIRDVKQSQASI